MENDYKNIVSRIVYDKDGKIINKTYQIGNKMMSTDSFWIQSILDVQTSISYTMKTIKKECFLNKDKILWQINNHQKVNNNHPNFIKLIQIFEDHKHIYIMMEPFGESLYEILHNRRGYFLEREVQYIFCQLVNILQHLRINNVAHQNISLNSIFIQSSKLNIKLGDFSQSWNLQNNYQLVNKIQSNPYSSPEQILPSHNEEELPPNDIWAVGVVLFNLLVGQQPFCIAETVSTSKIQNCSFQFSQLNGRQFLSNVWKELFKRIFKPVKDRITLRELIQHPLMDIQQTFAEQIEPQIPPTVLHHLVTLHQNKKLRLSHLPPKRKYTSKIIKIPNLVFEPPSITRFYYAQEIKCLGYVLDKSLGVLYEDNSIIIGHNQSNYQFIDLYTSSCKRKIAIYKHFVRYFGERIITGDLSVWVNKYHKQGNVIFFQFNTGTWQVNMTNGISLIDQYGLGWWKHNGCQIHRVKHSRKMIRQIQQKYYQTFYQDDDYQNL